MTIHPLPAREPVTLKNQDIEGNLLTIHKNEAPRLRRDL